jgi:hypothetical protein
MGPNAKIGLLSEPVLFGLPAPNRSEMSRNVKPSQTQSNQKRRFDDRGPTPEGWPCPPHQINFQASKWQKPANPHGSPCASFWRIKWRKSPLLRHNVAFLVSLDVAAKYVSALL